MPDDTEDQKIEKIIFARYELEKSSNMVLEMSDSIQQLLEKFERTKAKQDKKRQKIMEELMQKNAEVADFSAKNEQLKKKQKNMKSTAENLKKDINAKVLEVLGNMEEKFKLLEAENERLRTRISSSESNKSS